MESLPVPFLASNINSAATLEFNEEASRIFEQIMGFLTDDFAPWIPGVDGLRTPLSTHEVQMKRRVKLKTESHGDVTCTIRHVDFPELQLRLDVTFSPKIRRFYWVSVRADSDDKTRLHLDLNAEIEEGIFFGPKVEHEQTHFNSTISQLRSLHLTGRVRSAGFD